MQKKKKMIIVVNIIKPKGKSVRWLEDYLSELLTGLMLK